MIHVLFSHGGKPQVNNVGANVRMEPMMHAESSRKMHQQCCHCYMLPPKLTPQTNHHLWPTPTVELFSQYQIITGLYEPVKPDALVFGDGDEIC